MKRSEMIEDIVSVIKGIPETKGVPKDKLQGIAHAALLTCENLGMSPPRYTGLISTGEEYDRENPNHFGKDLDYFSSWEPENV